MREAGRSCEVPPPPLPPWVSLQSCPLRSHAVPASALHPSALASRAVPTWHPRALPRTPHVRSSGLARSKGFFGLEPASLAFNSTSLTARLWWLESLTESSSRHSMPPTAVRTLACTRAGGSRMLCGRAHLSAPERTCADAGEGRVRTRWRVRACASHIRARAGIATLSSHALD